MNDRECVQFLQWAVPQLHMRWPGFRRVRNQVCKRLQKRLDQLNLGTLDDYRAYLAERHDEWRVLDSLCQVTISRFYRDKMVFSFLAEQVLPRLLTGICKQQQPTLRIWSAGCGSGEEPYTFSILWAMQFAAAYPAVKLSILGTDSNQVLLDRAHHACYPYSAIKNLPGHWRETAFETKDSEHCLLAEYRANTEFLCEDIRRESPVTKLTPAYNIVCCRNLAFTYFDEQLQYEVAQRINHSLADDGVLLIGVHEKLPPECTGFESWSSRLGIYRKSENT